MFDDEQQNEQNNQDLNNFTEGLDADVINNASETSSYTDSSVQKDRRRNSCYCSASKIRIFR